MILLFRSWFPPIPVGQRIVSKRFHRLSRLSTACFCDIFCSPLSRAKPRVGGRSADLFPPLSLSLASVAIGREKSWDCGFHACICSPWSCFGWRQVDYFLALTIQTGLFRSFRSRQLSSCWKEALHWIHRQGSTWRTEILKFARLESICRPSCPTQWGERPLSFHCLQLSHRAIQSPCLSGSQIRQVWKAMYWS